MLFKQVLIFYTVDVEAKVNKIFQYFHIYTVRVEELKEFCDFVSFEYKQVLGSVKIRWLSLQSAITRVIDMFPGFKSYFLSQEKCPMMLKIFFNDPISVTIDLGLHTRLHNVIVIINIKTLKS
jgi:hypothetical protein